MGGGYHSRILGHRKGNIRRRTCGRGHLIIKVHLVTWMGYLQSILGDVEAAGICEVLKFMVQLLGRAIVCVSL